MVIICMCSVVFIVAVLPLPVINWASWGGPSYLNSPPSPTTIPPLYLPRFWKLENLLAQESCFLDSSGTSEMGNEPNPGVNTCLIFGSGVYTYMCCETTRQYTHTG